MIPRQVLFCEYLEIFKNGYFKQNLWTMLVNNVEPFFNPFIWRRCSYKCFSTLAGKHLCQNFRFNKCICRSATWAYLYSKEVTALVFSWQLSEIFNNNFVKEYCYKSKSIVIRNMDQISTANLIMQLFI